MPALHLDALDIPDISRFGGRLADALDATDPSTPVPTCGEWTLVDLAWHLTEVQRFWIHVIGGRPSAGPETYDYIERPEGAAASQLRAAGIELVALLEAADPAETAWSWAEEQTVAFTIRRQIHEALVHSIDADLAVGRPLPDVPPKLAADGVDEIIGVMLTGTPEWANFEPADGALRLSAVDTGDHWTLQAGTVTGTPPEGDTEVRLPGYEFVDVEPTAVVEANAVDLLLWMWGRLDESVLTRSSDHDATQLLRTTITDAAG